MHHFYILLQFLKNFNYFPPTLVTININDSLSTNGTMSLNTTMIGIVTITAIGSILLSSYADAYAYNRDYYNSYNYYYEVLREEFWRHKFNFFYYSTLSTQPSYWNGISNMSSVCYDNGVPVISTPLTIYLSSPLYTPAQLDVYLSIESYYPYYHYSSKSYTITITTPDCAPSERYDQISQKCVITCGCGLVNHQLPFCLFFGKPPC